MSAQQRSDVGVGQAAQQRLPFVVELQVVVVAPSDWEEQQATPTRTREERVAEEQVQESFLLEGEEPPYR